MVESLAQAGLEALSLSLLLSTPALLAGGAVALLVGVLQAATQIQDPTLSFVPRLFAVAAALAGFGSWMGQAMLEFTRELWRNLALVGS